MRARIDIAKNESFENGAVIVCGGIFSDQYVYNLGIGGRFDLQTKVETINARRRCCCFLAAGTKPTAVIVVFGVKVDSVVAGGALVAA